MKKLSTSSAVLAVLFAAGSLAAGERGTPEEAKALLAKAVKQAEADGSAKALAAFNDPKGAFRDRDLYVFCYGPDHKLTAHVNPKMIGTDIADVKDADGRSIGAEMVKVIAAGGGTISYRYMNPATKKVEAKQSFLAKAGDQICGVGAYK